MATSIEQPGLGQDGTNNNPSKGLEPSTSNGNGVDHPSAEYLRVILQSLQTMKDGDFSVRLPVAWTGLAGKIADNFNEIVTANEQMAFELKRVGQAVGKEGKTRERIRVERRRGAWDDMEVSVNTLVEDLLRPTTEVTRAIAAVAQGNLTQTVRLDVDGRPLEGEFLRSANIVNSMIQQLGIFTAEVTRVAREVGTEGKLGGQAQVPGVAGTWKDLTDNVNVMAANLTEQVRGIVKVVTAVANGALTQKLTVNAKGEVAALKDNINTMIDNLRLTTDRNTEQDWLKTNLARFTGMLQGQRDLGTVGRMLLSELAPLINAQQGVIYQMESEATQTEGALVLLSAYADTPEGHLQTIRIGEGLVGQCASEKRRMLITDLPKRTAPIRSGLFKATPTNVIVLPVLFEDRVKAVIELASLNAFTASHLAFLEQLTASIGVVLNSIEATMQTEGLLKQSQQLATELQTQQKELQQTNEQLAQKAQQLAEQNYEVERKNQEIEQARRALEEKARELALTSKYKSEFLANMSHELRTPLNSILVLGQQLAENPDGSLSPKQVEFARTIHGAGTDLLNLISDILDLSKIESGTVSVEAEEIFFGALLKTVARPFRHEAENRKVSFEFSSDPRMGRSLVTDSKRLQQVLKNLLSNAFKFTEQGSVRLSISRVSSGWSPDHPILSGAGSVIAFQVSDTGIGIPPEKQRIIFEAFQQADAGTNRKYGGTGLGLAISRELASLLGGEIQLKSVPGQGSTFTFYLPQTYMGPAASSVIKAEKTSALAPAMPVFLAQAAAAEQEARIEDDRNNLMEGDAVLLIVEDDLHYAHVLCDLSRDKGFKVLCAMTGTEALALAQEYGPTAISLDVFLPDMLGWTVLNHLKQDPKTRHIPVQMLTLDEDRHHGLARGAFAFVTKPTSTEGLDKALTRIWDYSQPRRKRLLVVEDNPAEQMSILELLGHKDIDIDTVDSGAAALQTLMNGGYDCAVLDLRLPDITGFEVLEKLRDTPQLQDLPVVVFTGRNLTAEEDSQLHTLARSVVVKDVESPERLLDETALFLHRVVADLPPAKQDMLDRLHRSDDALAGRKVLVVDDDVRNTFALSSVLERRGMTVLSAGTGREAIETIEITPELSIVLMDIMMPEMDGYETMRVIRQNPSLRRLPIIALTAKAMKGDREKCLDAGASEYLAKPVNTEQLLSALRMWLHR
jgi:CheY-like chemotaxis protein/signal transduction histidine kinase/HAMP domain-containing protein